MSVLEWSRFFGRMMRNPRAVGAVAPSSAALARLIAEQIPVGIRVLELGPGTGVVTRALLERGIVPERLVTIEADPRFAAVVRARLPGIDVIDGDAFDLSLIDRHGPFGAAVSGIPLLNFPPDWVAELVGGILARLPRGAPFVQFSYGLGSPVPALPGTTATMVGLVRRNLPPARVWVYRRY